MSAEWPCAASAKRALGFSATSPWASRSRLTRHIVVASICARSWPVGRSRLPAQTPLCGTGAGLAPLHQERLDDVARVFSSSPEVAELVNFIRSEANRPLCMPHP